MTADRVMGLHCTFAGSHAMTQMTGIIQLFGGIIQYLGLGFVICNSQTLLLLAS